MGVIRDLRDLYRDLKNGYREEDIDKKFMEWDNTEDRLFYFQ